jgi:hypothetical protein
MHLCQHLSATLPQQARASEAQVNLRSASEWPQIHRLEAHMYVHKAESQHRHPLVPGDDLRLVEFLQALNFLVGEPQMNHTNQAVRLVKRGSPESAQPP